jgi:post-segregation antitoxin (ccd killing protein)
MARLKRKGEMATFSVSVSAETKRRLRKAADRAYGGNVSALVEGIALEVDRQGALDWLLNRAPPIDEKAFETFMREMAGPKRKRARRAA